jgi:L-lactate dehydrogenase
MKKLLPSGRVVIVGAGNVGSSIAYSILNQEIAKSILIIDIAEDLAKAQVLDLQDAAKFTHGVNVKYASYSDLEDGDIVVITCGAAQKEGQTRLDLLQINAKIIRSVISEIKNSGKDVYICMVTNPVDVLTFIAKKESGLEESQVFGSGTYLDSARLRVAIAKELNVNPTNVHANILGEHGDSSFPVLSSANIASIPLGELVTLNDEYYNTLAKKVRDTAYEIIKGKNATYYGIGSGVAKIVKAIMRDEDLILPLSVEPKGQYGLKDLAIGLPVRLGAEGYRFIGEVSLSDKEKEMLNASANVLKENIKNVL